MIWRVAACALAVRLALLSADLYRSTDFEVHRNWLAITHSLPLSRWYWESTSAWTLDYPPAFAYFEWLLSQLAVVADSDMVRVENLEYTSFATVLFQRLTVVFGDVVLALGVWRASHAGPSGSRLLAAGASSTLASAPLALVLFNPALLLVDHVHFQYNGMLFGVLLLSVAEVETGHVYRGAALFCFLLNMKQIFLYVAPVYFVYLLRGHCGFDIHRRGFRLRLSALLNLSAVVIACFVSVWTPIVLTGQVQQTASRLFPFGRGLTHAYWAPNFWALYNTVDRVLSKCGFGAHGGRSSTAGFAEIYESSVLWTIPPKATFVLTVLAYLPLLHLIWRRTPPAQAAGSEVKAQPSHRIHFGFYVALGCAVSFALGWHVHEKAILMVTVPLLACVSVCGSHELVSATGTLSLVATFSVLPLMPKRHPETLLKWVMLVVGHASELYWMRWFQRDEARRAPQSRREGTWLSLLAKLGLESRLRYFLFLVIMVLLGLYCDFGGHELVFGRKMEFLPLMLISDFCAILVLGHFVQIFLLISGMEVL